MPESPYFQHLRVPAARWARWWGFGAAALTSAALAILIWADVRGFATPQQSLVYAFGIAGLSLFGIIVYRDIRNFGIDMTHEGVLVKEPKERLVPWRMIRQIHSGQRRGLRSWPVWLELENGRDATIPGTRFASDETRASVVEILNDRRAKALARKHPAEED